MLTIELQIAEPINLHIPVQNPLVEAQRSRQTIEGEVPSAQRPPTGCHFHPRCPHVMPLCKEKIPELLLEGHRMVACHLFT
ncbi:oligopeptide/dipeptide ABC transporter ATP-binding protein [Bradyrhizobium cosmicum]|uniref:oligopeptide/dipeptide ABC transporter ATP-binding protein n=1 Tax=Bradyrhizobium cosmicum TaxID=1404864 RepID=UPI0039657BAB